MAVQVWSVEEFLEKARAHLGPESPTTVNDGPSWVQSVQQLGERAHARGDGVAVYTNEDLGHPEVGKWQVMSYGSESSQLETRHPVQPTRWPADDLQSTVHTHFVHGQDAVPVRLPDIGGQINWRYQLHAIVPSYAQLELAEAAGKQIEVVDEPFERPADLWKHLQDQHHTDTHGLGDADLERWHERHEVKLHRVRRQLAYPHTHVPSEGLPHLVAHHGYDRFYVDTTDPDVLAAEHDRLHDDDTAVNLDHNHIGEAFNDPRVPCCGRDAADCDCSTTLVLPTPELWELRRVWEGGDDAELQRRIVGLVRDIFDGQDGELRRLNDIGPDSDHKPISLQIIDGDTDHFVVAFNRPGRIEVSRFSTDYQKVLAHVYEGADVAPDQRPLFAYDGTLTENEDVAR